MKILLSIFCLLILVSCSPTPEIQSDQLVERQGITYEVNSQTPFTGISVEYYLDTIIKNEFEERVLKTRIIFKDGIREGLYESFHLNGQLEMRGNFIDGKEDGLKESYYDEGQLEVRGNFIDGKMVGLFEVYYDNGQLSRTGNFIDGKEDGLWETFDEGGNLTETKEYLYGELIE